MMKRPTLVYSAKSVSDLSSAVPIPSRSSTPPSTPFYQSLEADPIDTIRRLSREEEPSNERSNASERKSRQVHKGSILQSLFKKPSIASWYHYLSLFLSIRLLFHLPRLSIICLTIVLATTLEGRAKIEKLGLRGTMKMSLLVVCVALFVWNLSYEVESFRRGWSESQAKSSGNVAQNQGGICGPPSQTSTVVLAVRSSHEEPMMSMTVCGDVNRDLTDRGIELSDDKVGELLSAAGSYLLGLDYQHHSPEIGSKGKSAILFSPLQLCRQAKDASQPYLRVPGKISIHLAFEARAGTLAMHDVQVIEALVHCVVNREIQ